MYFDCEIIQYFRRSIPLTLLSFHPSSFSPSWKEMLPQLAINLSLHGELKFGSQENTWNADPEMSIEKVKVQCHSSKFYFKVISFHLNKHFRRSVSLKLK